MRTITISIDDSLADDYDRFIKKRGYCNRSEAFRDLLRGVLAANRLQDESTERCVGTLSYVYGEREAYLSHRVADIRLNYEDVTVSVMHAHVDRWRRMEALILHGPTDSVTDFANSVMALRGIQHASFHPVPIEVETPYLENIGPELVASTGTDYEPRPFRAADAPAGRSKF